MEPTTEGPAHGTAPEPAARYDAAYYAHGCGDRPYRRDEVWLGFFEEVAARIASDIAPETVLDAGCAMGFLVEALARLDVDAWGIDISAYAIEQVHDSVRERCRVGSILEPLERRYDLICCIEVLEHLSPPDADRAIANLCAHTDDVLFSSTPHDHREPTHRAVRPPEHWAAAFARHGFYRDVDFDATFLTPWAARFRRHHGPIAPVIAAYERRLAWLTRASHERRDAIAEGHRERAALQERAAALEAEAEQLRRARAAVEATAVAARADAERWRSRWAALESTRTWRLLRRLWRWRDGLLGREAETAAGAGAETGGDGPPRQRG